MGYSLVALSAVALHAYTAWTAYTLAASGWLQFAAAYAAWALPPLSELVVVFFARRATGSWINGYSFWVLAWSALLVAVLLFHRIAGGADTDRK